MIEHQWQELIYRFDNIKLHEFIVMPNHFHGIIEFVGVPLVGTQNVEQPPIGQPQGIAPTVGDVVFCEEMCQDFNAARFANVKT